LLPQLVSAIEATAPGVSLWFTPQSAARVEALLSSERAAGERVDIVLGPAPAVPHSGALVERALFDERFVCVVRKGHPALGKRWTPERFAALQHAFVAPGGNPGGVVDTALAKLGLTRRVGLAVPNFLAAPFAIAQSDLVATLPERIALLFSRSLPLEIVEPPVAVPGFRMFMYWHERAHHDPAHAWLRAQIANAAAALAPTARAKQAKR
jgi:DNA-binding transcriptional LysR family regulator